MNQQHVRNFKYKEKRRSTLLQENNVSAPIDVDGIKNSIKYSSVFDLILTHVRELHGL